jgi:hypothetical protein
MSAASPRNFRYEPSDTAMPARAAASTVEALMFSLCERGTAALAEPDTLRRLSELSVEQLREVALRVQKFKPEIARPWTPESVAVLAAAWSRVHA